MDRFQAPKELNPNCITLHYAGFRTPGSDCPVFCMQYFILAFRSTALRRKAVSGKMVSK